MSRNSKSARLHAHAKQFKHAENGTHGAVSTGNKGPAKTQPKHGKKRAWFQLFDTHRDWLNSLKKSGAKRQNTKNSSTAVESSVGAEPA